MTILDDLRQQQRLRAAEGYLDLVMVFADRWSLKKDIRDQVGQTRVERTCPRLISAETPAGHVRYLQGTSVACHGKLHGRHRATQGLRSNGNRTIFTFTWHSPGATSESADLDLAIQALEEAMSLQSRRSHHSLQSGLLLVSRQQRANGCSLSGPVV